MKTFSRFEAVVETFGMVFSNISFVTRDGGAGIQWWLDQQYEELEPGGADVLCKLKGFNLSLAQD
jgi:hypothetical protein